MDFIANLKTLIVGVLTAVTATVAPVVPSYNQNIAVKPEITPIAASTSETSTPLPLTGENYIQVQGTYSYIGQTIKYLFWVPKRGGSFSGAIQGACEAQAGGEYEGGNGGKIYGNVGGKCSMFGIKTQGSTKFSGYLYPDTKTVKLDVDNSPIHGFTVKYN